MVCIGTLTLQSESNLLSDAQTKSLAIFLELMKVDFLEDKSVLVWNKKMQMDVLSFALGRAPFETANRTIVGTRDTVVPILLPLNLRLKQSQTRIGNVTLMMN